MAITRPTFHPIRPADLRDSQLTLLNGNFTILQNQITPLLQAIQTLFVPIFAVSGPIGNATGSFVASNISLYVFTLVGSGSAVGAGLIGFIVLLDGVAIETLSLYANVPGVHTVLPTKTYATTVTAGSHTISYSLLNSNTLTDPNDVLEISALKLPTS